MMKFIRLIGTMLREKDGDLSHRKVIAFIFVFFVFLMIYFKYKTNNGDLYSDLEFASVISGALGISYIRQISMLKKPQ